MNVTRLLALAALICTVLSLAGSAYPLLTIAVLLLALAMLV